MSLGLMIVIGYVAVSYTVMLVIVKKRFFSDNGYSVNGTLAIASMIGGVLCWLLSPITLPMVVGYEIKSAFGF